MRRFRAGQRRSIYPLDLICETIVTYPDLSQLDSILCLGAKRNRVLQKE